MADFTPTWTDWTDPGPFRFWAQKVLPLVYDDSLSYYEVLCKVVAYLNTTITNAAALGGNVEGLRDAYDQLQEYVNDYFDNLDVQQEINTKLDDMAETGALTTLIQPFIDIQISSDVSRWLDMNIKPTTPAIDASLTVSGAAADAKVVGDKFDDVNSTLIDGTTIYNYVTDKNLNTEGELVNETGTCVSEFIPYTWSGATSYDCGDNTKLTYRIEFYDANKNHIAGFRNPSATGGVTYRGIDVETQVTGGTVAYVRFSFKTGTVGRIFKTAINVLWVAEATQIKGIIPSIGDLNSLQTTTKDNLVNAINEVAGEINEVAEEVSEISFPITPADTDFFYASPNILNPATVVNGQYVNQANGAFAANANHTRTDYVPVVGGRTYCIVNQNDDNVQVRYAFYDSTKTFIPNSGAMVNLSDINNVVTAPAAAAYMIISAITTYYPFMIARSNEKINYANYGDTYILPQYILSEDLTELIINLPSKIYALPGFETNIYYENLVENWEKYNFNIACSKGRDMKRGYTITPTAADAGTYTLSVIVSTKDGQSQKTATTTLVITPATAGAGETVKLLVLGDSTTANGTTIAKLHENFNDDNMTVNTLGTLGTAPNNMEGRGGWTFEYYNTLAERNGVTNPFYNPSTQRFDASYYFINTGVTIPDWFFINLGINDMFNYTSDSSLEAQIQRCVDYCDAMIASIKTASAAVKIGVCVTIPPNDSQDAFGKAYGCAQTRNRYKRNNLLWAHRVIAEYDNRESESIYLVPIHTNLDTVYNMGLETLPVNARNTTVTYESPIGNGGVHPVESGYWQIADVYTAFLKTYAE